MSRISFSCRVTRPTSGVWWTVALLAVATVTPAFSQTIYNSIPSPLPGNVASIGPEAYAYSQVGDGLMFSAGTPRNLGTVKVILSDWACTSGHWYNPVGTADPCVTTPGATFNQAITLNIFKVVAGSPPTPGALLATQTKTFQIPYRPSSDGPHCNPGGTPGGDGEEWYSATDNKCYHGFAFPIVFSFVGSGITLPDKVIVGVSFNSTHYGPSPVGEGTACFINGNNCPYDSLNVAVQGNPFIGGDFDPNGIYVNFNFTSSYCTGNQATSGTFRLDTDCWTDLHPEIEIDVTPRDVFQVSYAANLASGDSYVNITNAGTLGGYDVGQNISPAGGLCANVYVFDPSEEMVACCSCYVSPDGLRSLSAVNDLISKTLTPSKPNGIVIKLLASQPFGSGGTSCSPTSLQQLEPGLRAWTTTLHNNTTTSRYDLSEYPFTIAALSASELEKLVTFCGFIQANGSSFGVCKTCQVGGNLGGAQR